MADAVRIALLARPGNARDQLHRALSELGATLVAEGDPAELDVDEVTRQSPTLVLVSLEPAIEVSLERFDALLASDGIEVMYDDAEVTRQLDGWDLNRWARHLAAKLVGSELLPPAPGGSDLPAHDLQPVPGLPPTPAELMDDARLEDYTIDTIGMADTVPVNPTLHDVDSDTLQALPAMEAPIEAAMDFDLDLSGIEQAMNPVAAEEAEPAAPEPAAPADASHDDLTLDDDFNLEVDLSSLDLMTDDVGTVPAMEETEAEPLLADLDIADQPVSFSNFDNSPDDTYAGSLDADVAALAAQLDEFEKTDQRQAARDPDFAVFDDTAGEKPQGKPAPAAPARPDKQDKQDKSDKPGKTKAADLDFGNLSLTSMDEPVAAPPPSRTAAPAAKAVLPDISSLSLAPHDDDLPPPPPAPRAKEPAAAAAPKVSFGSLSLESDDDAPAAAPAVAAKPGVVLIVAGMGGPDAVRKMLSNLPEGLPVPVLLYQHLEVGKHERLVDQLGKISNLPVYLASEGVTAQAGRVAVLPAGYGAVNDGGTLRFGPGALADLIAALPARDSVLVMLSGADVALVPAVLASKAAGAQSYAQFPGSCFDPAAAEALGAQGVATHTADELARQVAARWLP